jgi:hypothetical protein
MSGRPWDNSKTRRIQWRDPDDHLITDLDPEEQPDRLSNQPAGIAKYSVYPTVTTSLNTMGIKDTRSSFVHKTKSDGEIILLTWQGDSPWPPGMDTHIMRYDEVNIIIKVGMPELMLI